MSTSLSDSRFTAARAKARSGPARPPWTPPAGTVQVVHWLGRIVVVALPATTLLVNPEPSAGVVAGTALVVAIWLAALVRASAVIPFALGTPAAALVGTVGGLAAVSALDLWLPTLALDPVLLLLTAGAVFASWTAWELAVKLTLPRKQRVLIIGSNECADAVVEGLAGAGETPFTVVGAVDGEPEGRVDMPHLGGVSELTRVVERKQPDLIVLADGGHSAEALDRLLEIRKHHFRVLTVPHFFEHALGRVPLRHLSPSWFMSILHVRQRPYSRLAKRLFDLAVACVVLVATAPLWPLVAAAVRLTGPEILFRQRRLGEGGRCFTMLKFRTMRPDAEAAGLALWSCDDDPRVTRVGRVLRRTRLDELPQLWNVIRGEMSIVGPRPERPEFVDLLERTVPFWSRRLLIKPGITGWAQVRRPYAADCESAADKLSYDLWYLRHRSVALDLAICAKTGSVMLFGARSR